MKAIWEIDCDPRATPEEAALDAFMIMQRRGTSANHFTIIDQNGTKTEVDLEALWEDHAAFLRARERAERETRFYLVAEPPGNVGRQVSAGRESREDFDRALAELRVTAEPGTRFFRVEINPFSVAVYGTAPKEQRDDSNRLFV
jgi:hypothetical protein